MIGYGHFIQTGEVKTFSEFVMMIARSRFDISIYTGGYDEKNLIEHIEKNKKELEEIEKWTELQWISKAEILYKDDIVYYEKRKKCHVEGKEVLKILLDKKWCWNPQNQFKNLQEVVNHTIEEINKDSHIFEKEYAPEKPKKKNWQSVRKTSISFLKYCIRSNEKSLRELRRNKKKSDKWFSDLENELKKLEDKNK